MTESRLTREAKYKYTVGARVHHAKLDGEWQITDRWTNVYGIAMYDIFHVTLTTLSVAMEIELIPLSEAA